MKISRRLAVLSTVTVLLPAFSPAQQEHEPGRKSFKNRTAFFEHPYIYIVVKEYHR